jgi:hypothetical protein
VSALVELRKERPTWGPKKLRARLAQLEMATPAASMVPVQSVTGAPVR